MNTRTVLVTNALLLTLSIPASAYVRTTTTAGVPTAWKAPCVTVEFSLGAPPPELEAEGYFSAAQAAGAAWSQASLDGVQQCSNVLFNVVSVPDVAGPVGMDQHNRLIFRQDTWCADPLPSDGFCYDSSALAITSVFQRKTSGEILDADLEVNAVNFTWGDYVGRPELAGLKTHDFQGAVTHEFGHIIGLDHTCFIPGATRSDGTLVPRPTDNNGNPVPNCGADNPPSITETTMYVSVATPGAEVEMRSLSPDDVQGACDIYPFTASSACGGSGTCSSPACLPPSGSGTTSGGGGCSYTARPGPGSMACVLGLLAMAMLARRRR
jgi:hypothetical protein